MSADVVRFVDRVAESPTILLDLNDEAGWATATLSTTPPRRRRMLLQSATLDGSIPTGEAYDDRVLAMRLELHAATHDEGATQVQRLMRLLQRPQWLMWQPVDAVAPLFFRTRAADATLIESLQVQISFHDITLELPAEPMGRGLPVEHEFTVGADPLTGGIAYDWPDEVQGDVATPLQLRFTGYGLVGGRWWTSHALLPEETTAFPLCVDSTAFVKTNNAGVTAVTSSSSLYAGGSSVLVTANNAWIAGTVALPVTPPGDYRLFLRGENLPNAWVSLVDGGGAHSVQRPVGFSTDAQLCWTEFGIVRLPIGAPMTSDSLGWVDPPAAAPQLQLSTTAAASFRLDAVMLVPAALDEQISSEALAVSLAPSSVETGWIDGEGRAVSFGVADGSMIDRTQFAAAGLGYPTLTPGARNVLHTFAAVTTDGAGGPALSSAPLSVWARYFPQYLYTRPALS